MRRTTVFALLGLASFTLLACDMLKKHDADAAVDAATTTPATTSAANTGAPPPTSPTSVPTLGTPTNTAGGGGHPVAHADGAAPAGDAAPAGEGGAAPVPTPTLTIPPFDAGAFKGFDAAGIPIPPGFDAGGFKPPWQK